MTAPADGRDSATVGGGESLRIDLLVIFPSAILIPYLNLNYATRSLPSFNLSLRLIQLSKGVTETMKAPGALPVLTIRFWIVRRDSQSRLNMKLNGSAHESTHSICDWAWSRRTFSISSSMPGEYRA